MPYLGEKLKGKSKIFHLKKILMASNMTEISKNRIRKLALLIEVDLNKCDM